MCSTRRYAPGRNWPTTGSSPRRCPGSTWAARSDDSPRRDAAPARVTTRRVTTRERDARITGRPVVVRARPLSVEEPVLLQPVLGHVPFALTVHVDPGVEVEHDLVGQLGGDRFHDLGDLRVLVQGLLAQGHRAGVLDEEALVVLEHAQVVGHDPAIGGEHLAELTT